MVSAGHPAVTDRTGRVNLPTTNLHPYLRLRRKAHKLVYVQLQWYARCGHELEVHESPAQQSIGTKSARPGQLKKLQRAKARNAAYSCSDVSSAAWSAGIAAAGAAAARPSMSRVSGSRGS